MLLLTGHHDARGLAGVSVDVADVWRRGSVLLVLAVLVVLAGCASAPRNYQAIDAYYRADYTAARDALRADAAQHDQQVLLNNARLGMAALADGDFVEAEAALGYSFELLSTAGLNADRTTAAVLMHEGVRIWKGEPFEQAMMYHYIAALYAVLGDWENVRAASANALFRLKDFGEHQTAQSLAKHAAADASYLDQGYRAVDTNFALGFLMQGIGARLSGAAGSDDLFDAALRIDPSLGDLVQQLREDQYNTLLIVHYGKGPTKIAYGPDDALSRFVQQEPASIARAALIVSDHLGEVAALPVTDVHRMASDHRWNNLEDIRRAKSFIGDVLVTGGAAAAMIGAQERSAEAAIAGIGAILLGALAKSGAKADTRYLEFLPQSVYLVPLTLEEVADLHLHVLGGTAMTVREVQPGMIGDPNVVYVRMHGLGAPASHVD